MHKNSKKLVEFLAAQVINGGAFRDILEIEPYLNLHDAYQLQFELMRQRELLEGPLIGYKAAYTNTEIQKLRGRSLMIGSLLKSMRIESGSNLNLGTKRVSVEPEIAILLKRELQGPGITTLDVFSAIEGFLPAIELEVPVEDRPKQSEQMHIATHKWQHNIILGNPLSAPHGIDLRLEGVVASINGTMKASGAGAEVLGNPLNVVAAMANKLAEFNISLKAGMILLTGTMVSKSIVAAPGDHVDIEFTRLGRVSVHVNA